MQRENVSEAVAHLAFEFFFCFSRFESALKENAYLKSKKPGARADPGWQSFVSRWEQEYTASPNARNLINLAPQTQIVAKGDRLDWLPTETKQCTSELAVVVLMLKTVRNSLFHGGKHGAANWDDLNRTSALLTAATSVLPELACLAGLESDYVRFY